MSKEMKAGIALVTLLVVVFCGVLYQRVSKLKQTQVAGADKKDGEKKTTEKSSLLGAPNKLTAVADSGGRDADAPPAIGSGFKWSSQASSDEPKAAAKLADAPTPPRASFLPAGDEPAKPNDRYASRYSDPADTNATQTNDSPTASGNDTSAPVAAANPFGRVATTEEPAHVIEESTAINQPTEAAPSEPLVSSDPAETATSESAPPARLDEDTVRAAAVESPRTSRFNISSHADTASETAPNSADNAVDPPATGSRYSRPASRFITADDEPAAKTTPPTSSRFAPPAGRSSLTTQPRGNDALASGKYTVEPNDNYWSISERVYGSGGYFKALHAYNKEKHPAQDELAVGDVISVPSTSDLERQFPTLCPKQGRKPSAKQSYAVQASAKLRADGKTYVVQEGDTLFDIARYELGKASRWSELYELNRDTIGDDLDFLRPGMELVLPTQGRASDSMTRQPGSSLR